jgi:hypothetical protein
MLTFPGSNITEDLVKMIQLSYIKEKSELTNSNHLIKSNCLW